MSSSIVFGADRLPTNFDMEQPEGFTNDLSSDLFGSMYDQLTSARSVIADNGTRTVDWHNLEGVLAESWWFSDDQRTCTFRIRRGVISHRGNELTAEDVKWGWERAFAMRDVGKWVARVSSVQEPTDIEVVDRYTVAYHLAAPNPSLPRTMAQCTPSVYDLAALERFRTEQDPWARLTLKEQDAGYGAYRLAGKDETEIVLEAHDRYWRGKAAIEEVHVRRLPEGASAIDALLAGDVDIVMGLTISQAAALRGKDGIRIVAVEGTPGLVLHLDVSEPPFDDPLLRQAVACAIPYQEIIQTAYLGDATRWRSYVQPQAPGYLNAWPYEENLERARKLLSEAGRPDGFSTRLFARPGEEVSIAAKVMVDGLARAGIQVELTSEPGVFSEPVGAKKANLGPMMLRSAGIGGRGNRVHDPIYAMYHDHAPGRMRLFPYAFENNAFYDALRAIPNAGHGAAWEAAAKKAQALLNADGATIPIAHYPSFFAMKRNLRGYRWYPDNRLPFYEMHWA